MTSKLEKLINDLLSSNPLYVAELCDEYIKDDGCKMICDKLSSIDTIHTIDFRGNDIQQIGAQSIVELIKQNKNITTIKLQWNLLGLQNALSTLCEGLMLSSIRHLDLRNNKISSNDGKIISKMLSNNKTLYHIDLRWNNLGLIGGECILQTLLTDINNNNNYTLTECLLSGNQIPVQILRSIDDILNKSKQYKSIQPIQQIQRIQSIESIESAQSISELTNDSIQTVENNNNNVQINESLQQKNETIQILQEELNDLFGEKTCLKDQNEAIQIKYDDLECENLDLKDKYYILQNEKEILEKNITELDTKYDTNTQELQNKIHSLEVTVNELTESRQLDKSQYEDIKKLIENKYNIEINKLRETKDFELNNLRKTVNELHIEINELKTSNNTLRSEILENEILMERKYIEFEKNIRNECNKTLNDKINGLEKNISLIKKSRDDLEFEMKTEKNKYSQLMEQIETEKNQYQKWLNDEQKAKTLLENEKRNLSIDIQKYINVITQKKQQIESLKIGLKETNKCIKQLENEHQITIRRVLCEHNKQILILEKSLRENQRRLTMSDHRKRNVELRLLKVEDEQQRKIAAVNDAIKCLTNQFVISNTYSYNSNSYTQTINTIPIPTPINVAENKENEQINLIHTINHSSSNSSEKNEYSENKTENKMDCIQITKVNKIICDDEEENEENDEEENEEEEDINEEDEDTIIEIIADDQSDLYSIDEYSIDDNFSIVS